ncbi:hypothetical protein BAE36_22180 [Rhizobium leguminosarum bv. trifolii]|uniref:Uncharacterized protein n=1 Tax=Rhizobium leguminosarum bv. trifolii TaxID=386 RepID=A0A1B8R877_RHILT|nr:hypothetical protein [Rhizobium leguminosarum]AOO92156.1 hypothetical protein [Rhizobium leguminosarum bv. trifolii]OBY05059.1 hypothetical protein BAE36_22180 [Rhizobium leguminosarum bv. trifolii]TBY18803.1 hypothetical protein E0H30_21285 [Rhizobium leguminosarum bv. viciae]TBY27023.1 hypothetical protein E0H37_18595 [Rhizobium leguminosarum bv. viciae]TBZ02046.1 hypothetical protein E0H49_10550 [Rhizobium leguminosarum bv. viciae]
MTQTTDEVRNPASSQADIDTWRILKKALKIGLSDRGFIIEAEEASLVARFMLEQIETSGLRVVPVKPTTEMQQAIKQALDHGRRMSVAWVKPRTKQRWRYQAAVEAAPNWRRGYLLDLGLDGGQPKG